MNRAILIKSCEKHAERRQACELTWRGDLGLVVPANFVVGGGNNHLRSDRCLVVDSGDEYQDNSIKLRAALEALLSQETTPDDFMLFVCDDDTFVYPQRWLAHEPSGELECRLYHPRTPAEIHMNDAQPWINGGAGFYMSRRLCELYVAEVKIACSWDDILVSQIAARHGIETTDRPDLYTDDRFGSPSWRVSKDNPSAITFHPCEPGEMREMYRAIRAEAVHNVLP